jgi:chemotaxis protein methyltransferase CheR
MARPSGADLESFHALLRERSGLEFPESRQGDLERALRQALADTGLPDMRALAQFLAQPQGQPTLQKVITAVTVGETHFFRNRPQFDALERHVLPELIARRRSERRLRIWCAGCSSGEEPYSLAILLERLLPDLESWDIYLLATDINPRVLDKARRGVYTPWSFRQVDPEVQAAYFEPIGTGWEIAARFRERVNFALLNLVGAARPMVATHEMDLILCRNVLIYFNEATVRAVVARLHANLSEGGWLFVGHAEASPEFFGRFVVHNFGESIAFRKGVVAAAATVGLPEVPVLENAVTARPVPRPAPREEPAVVVTAESDYQAACDHADRMEWSEARRLIERALAQDALSARCHYVHGMILQEQGDGEAALAALRRCVFLDADFVLGHVALAKVLAGRGQHQRALRALETADELLARQARGSTVVGGKELTVGRLRDLVAERRTLVGEAARLGMRTS